MKPLSGAALVLGLAGGTLDFYGASYGMLMGQNQMVGTLILVSVGILATATGIAAVLRAGGGRRRELGLVMEACGVVMALVSSWAPMSSVELSDLMLVVGALMFLNGILMQRRGMEPAKASSP
jgi:hypothetical protein